MIRFRLLNISGIKYGYYSSEEIFWQLEMPIEHILSSVILSGVKLDILVHPLINDNFVKTLKLSNLMLSFKLSFTLVSGTKCHHSVSTQLPSTVKI